MRCSARPVEWSWVWGIQEISARKAEFVIDVGPEG
jgi:hypothetical protein